MCLYARAHVDLLERIKAVGQLRLVLVAQLALASIAAQLVDGSKVVAIDGVVSIAVLAELGHVILDRVGRAVGIVHAIGIRCSQINVHQMYDKVYCMGNGWDTHHPPTGDSRCPRSACRRRPNMPR